MIKTAKRLPPPPPCLITRYNDAGEIVTVEEVTRDPIRQSGWEPESLARNFRVMALQETGEEQFVGYARTRHEGNTMADRHLETHPEHKSAWVERVGE